MSEVQQVTVITGLPRSGTMAAAKHLGYLHESQFRGEEPTPPPPGVIQSEVSSMAMPLVPVLAKRDDVTLVHLVREPEAILRSLHRRGGQLTARHIEAATQGTPLLDSETEFRVLEPFTNADPLMGAMLRVTPNLLDMPLHDRAPYWMYHWTKVITDLDVERIRLEDVDWPRINASPRGIFPQADWRSDNCIQSEWWPRVLELFSEFGYG